MITYQSNIKFPLVAFIILSCGEHMNKEILKKSIEHGIFFEGNFAIHNYMKRDLNKFLMEVNKQHFTKSLEEAIKISKEKLFRSSNK